MSAETVLFALLVLLVVTVPLGILVGYNLRRRTPPVPPAHPHRRTTAVWNDIGEDVDRDFFPDPRRQ